MQLRNPWGKKEWLGPWSDFSNTWDKYPHVDQQLRQRADKDTKSVASTGTLGAADDGRFWMLFKDFFQYFYNITINYTRDDYYHTRIVDQIQDESWGVCELYFPEDPKGMVFVSIFQMNSKFFDPEEDLQDVITTQDKSKAKDIGDMMFVHEMNEVVKENQAEQAESEPCEDKGEGFCLPPLPEKEEDKENPNSCFKAKKPKEAKSAKDQMAEREVEYPKLELIVCRRGALKADKEVKNADGNAEVLAYMDGTEGEEPCLTLRLNEMKKGYYYILYRPDFKPRHTVRRLNLVVYSEFMAKKSPEEIKEYELEQLAHKREMAKYAKMRNAQLQGALSTNELPKVNEQLEEQIPGGAIDDNKSEGAEIKELHNMKSEGLSDLKSMNSDR